MKSQSPCTESINCATEISESKASTTLVESSHQKYVLMYPIKYMKLQQVLLHKELHLPLMHWAVE